MDEGIQRIGKKPSRKEWILLLHLSADFTGSKPVRMLSEIVKVATVKEEADFSMWPVCQEALGHGLRGQRGSSLDPRGSTTAVDANISPAPKWCSWKRWTGHKGTLVAGSRALILVKG
jgi:hypothetical protein